MMISGIFFWSGLKTWTKLGRESCSHDSVYVAQEVALVFDRTRFQVRDEVAVDPVVIFSG